MARSLERGFGASCRREIEEPSNVQFNESGKTSGSDGLR